MKSTIAFLPIFWEIEHRSFSNGTAAPLVLLWLSCLPKICCSGPAVTGPLFQFAKAR